MIIKYCPDCFGKPYTSDFSLVQCPLCGGNLETASVDVSELEGRMQLPSEDGNSGSSNEDDACCPVEIDNSELVLPTDDVDGMGFSDESAANASYIIPTTPKRASGGRVTVVGKVSQYRVSDKKDGYRRYLPRKLSQAIFYGQRLEDHLHNFVVTEDNGERHVVNVHGTTNYGAAIVDNERVEVQGKIDAGVLLAEKVYVLNGSSRVQVKFQRDVKTITIVCCIAILLLLGLIGFGNAGSASGVGLFTTIKNFLTTMFAVYVVLLVLYVVSLFTKLGFMLRLLGRGGRGSSPLLTMLVLSFIITLLLYNVFGLGSMLAGLFSSALSAVGPIAIVIIGIVLLVKAMF